MNSPAKLLLILVVMAGSLSAQADPATTVPKDNPIPHAKGWLKDCDDKVAAAKGKTVDLLFIGDSITQNFVGHPNPKWKLVGGPVWDKHYATRNAFNLGVGSDGTEHILWRLDHQDIKDFRPKVIILMVGVNDMQYPAEDIAAGAKSVLEKCRALYPAAKVVLMGITPNRRDMVKTETANKLIQTNADERTIFFLDLTPQMPKQDKGWKGVGSDLVHLTEEGYEIWASSLDPLLEKLMVSQ